MNPFSKVRSAVLTLNTRTIAEPLLAAAGKTEGEVTIYLCSFSTGLPLFPVISLSFPVPILPSAVTGSTLKTHINRYYVNKPLQDPGYMYKYSLYFSALAQKIGTAASRRTLPGASLIPCILFLNTASSKLFYLKRRQQKLTSHNSQDYSHKDAFIKCKA